jgi:sigma-E factor negative regulatory protein RseA
MEKMQTQELISALVDGQLQGEAFARGVHLAASDPVGSEAWHAYHLIGDVLRSGELAAGAPADAFLGKLSARLGGQQVGDLPAVQVLGTARTVSSASRPAANDANFRWKVVAGVASCAAVAAIAWSVVGGVTAKPEQAQMATAVSAPAAVAASSAPGVMIRDPRLDEFLAAHRQLGGASALQMPAGFLRNATFESGSR